MINLEGKRFGNLNVKYLAGFTLNKNMGKAHLAEDYSISRDVVYNIKSGRRALSQH